MALITAICGLFACGVYPSWNPRDERPRIQESREKNHCNGDSYHGLVVVVVFSHGGGLGCGQLFRIGSKSRFLLVDGSIFGFVLIVGSNSTMSH